MLDKIKKFEKSKPLAFALLLFLISAFILYLFFYGGILPYFIVYLVPSIITGLYLARHFLFLVTKKLMNTKQNKEYDAITQGLMLAFVFIVLLSIVCFFTIIGFRTINVNIVNYAITTIQVNAILLLLILIIKKVRKS